MKPTASGRHRGGTYDSAAAPDDGPAAGAVPRAGSSSRVARRYADVRSQPSPLAARLATSAPDRDPTAEDAATVAVEQRGGGQPVDAAVRSRSEAHLGADLSGVRVHSDPLSGEASAAIRARAFTYDRDVFLGPGESPADVPLMADELTHGVARGVVAIVVARGARPRGAGRQGRTGASSTPRRRIRECGGRAWRDIQVTLLTGASCTPFPTC